MIEKLKYEIKSYLPSRQNKSVYLIESEQIMVSIYKENSRKLENKKIITIQHTDFDNLCTEIESCIQSADRLDWFYDDLDCKLTIYHPFGRVETMSNGLGNKGIYIGKIIESFLKNYK